MSKNQSTIIDLQKRVSEDSRSALDTILRDGAQRMLQSAIELEVAQYIDEHRSQIDEAGLRLVVRNGHQKEREILSGAGALTIKKPRVYDRRQGHHFVSSILPKYLRRSPSIDALVPALYLKGISTSGVQEALASILGDGAAGLSPANIVRLKEGWQQEYEAWSKRDLSTKRYVYLWADGIYFNVRLTKERPCMLVIIGTLPSGRKELVAILDGERESKLSWKELLLGLKRRGLTYGPELAIADGGLGSLEEVFPGAKSQRCWVHKTANILDKMPKSIHPAAKQKIHEMYLSPTKKKALEAYDDFLALFEDKYPKACVCLKKDKAVLFTFYDFPAAHWQHLRTTNPWRSRVARIDVCYRSAPYEADQGMRIENCDPVAGLQTRHGSRKEMASASRLSPRHQSDERDPIRRRCRDQNRPTSSLTKRPIRTLLQIPSSTTFCYISL